MKELKSYEIALLLIVGGVCYAGQISFIRYRRNRHGMPIPPVRMIYAHYGEMSSRKDANLVLFPINDFKRLAQIPQLTINQLRGVRS